MRPRICWVLALCLLACLGCGKKKSTAELIDELKAPNEGARHSAVRLLPQRRGEASQIVPALIEALKDREGEVRRSAALGLARLATEPREAIPALQAAQGDRDARVREAAGIALSHIDPQQFPAKSKTEPGQGK